MKYFFRSLPRNALRVFSPRYLLWHLLAILSTYIIVVTGKDWSFFLSTRFHTLTLIAFPAIILGALLPLLIPLKLLILSRFPRWKEWNIYGWALLQATVLGSFVSSLYKAVTGRVQPDLYNLGVDSSHHFNFGFFEHGIFWGWPSSHTTIAFSMAVTFFILYGKKRVASYAALVYAFYIAAGVALVGIHWFSEAVAGIIIGSIVGVVVGKSFKKEVVDPRKPAGVS